MHHGALGVQNEIGPSCALVDLTGPILTMLGVLAGRRKPALAAVHSESRRRRLMEVPPERGCGLLSLPASRRLW